MSDKVHSSFSHNVLQPLEIHSTQNLIIGDLVALRDMEYSAYASLVEDVKFMTNTGCVHPCFASICHGGHDDIIIQAIAASTSFNHMFLALQLLPILHYGN